jgi:ribonuclease P protein component
MLSKSHRLTRPQLLLARRSGVRVQTDHFVFISFPNNLGHLRLAVEISTKFAKLAVTRNQVRRVLMDYFRLNRQISAPYDVIIIVKSSLKNLSTPQITAVLDLETPKSF